MSKMQLTTIVLLALVISGCAEGPKSSYGFTLPDGDADNGKELFTSYTCHECHTVSGVELPKLDFQSDKLVRIGGEVGRIQTYGELVTSVINPSHKLAFGYRQAEISDDGESNMTNYNDVMTVKDLIDIVAFLQSRYRLKPYEPTPYDVYHFGS